MDEECCCLELLCGICIGALCLKAAANKNQQPQQQMAQPQYQGGYAGNGAPYGGNGGYPGMGHQQQPYGYPPNQQGIYVNNNQGPPPGYPGSGGPGYPGQAKVDYNYAQGPYSGAPPVATGYPIGGYPGSGAPQPGAGSNYAGFPQGYPQGGRGVEGKPTGNSVL